MNLDKTTPILKKINRLYELIDIKEISITEKDLLKGYVMDLFKAITDAEKDDKGVAEIAKEKKKKKKKEKKILKAIEKKKQPKEEPVSATAATSAAAVIAEPVRKVVSKKKEVVETKVVEKSAVQKPSSSSEMAELFAAVSGNELSDKLSQSPIKDLTKSMGINERMFTISELFGGNQEEMDNLLVALNGLANYEEAKDVLIKSAATKYNWTDASTFKKARTFVKLVQRRYK